jgi:hypothetical protein
MNDEGCCALEYIPDGEIKEARFRISNRFICFRHFLVFRFGFYE